MANIDGPVDTFSKVAVNLPLLPAQAGFGVLLGENHDGAAGLAALRRSIFVSPEKRLGVGMDSPLFEDVFHHTVINTRKYFQSAATMTVALAGGFMTLNSGASSASGVGIMQRSYRSFPVMGNYPTILDFAFSLALVPQAQNNIEIGIGIPGTSITSPSDGVYLLIDTAGALQLVANYNGAVTTSGAITFAWTANRVYHGEIVIHTDRAELYIDGIYRGEVLRSAANTVGAMAQNQSGHLFCRLHNAAVTAGAQKLNIARWSATLGDGAFARAWGAAKSGMGDHALSASDGQAVAQLANSVNSTAPVSATLSNTAAGYTTLGGAFQFAAVAGAETDYALFGFQVPAAAAGAPGKTLMITGIEIDTFNTGAAVATSATLMVWSLAVGASAVSLATADGVTSRAPHRVMLGSQSLAVGAAIGARADRAIAVDFSAAPLPVEPGAFVHVILRMPVGTATAAQIIRGLATIKGYFE
jgi:hypothetical protein